MPYLLFLKSGKIFNCRLLQIIGGALKVKMGHDFGTYRICAKTLLDAHADVFSEARGLKFGPSLHLQPCFVYLGSNGSGEFVH